MRSLKEQIALDLQDNADSGTDCRNCGNELKALPVFVPDSPKPFYCTDCERVEFRE